AFLKSEPQLLEPVCDLEVLTPEDVMGDVMSDLQGRRSVVMGMGAQGTLQVIKVRTPLAELDRYSTTLRSLSQGRARFNQRLADYASVPYDVQARIARKFQEVEL